ncbi:MAG: hypothetical protein Q8J68_13905 [Methanolobus sp.]|uniref:hypothetical protein n=1 Tax=Methanolobus sp. TaxID=1874737 RepID=UPI00272FBB88|nr:hypothetical protein [Methanolobus sp.]MDP2218367.1 hypothetical protein [Methanolobus sp.]
MLGEIIGEFNCHEIRSRVLISKVHGTKIETTEQTQGKLLGIEVSGTITYSTRIIKKDGTFYSEGQGVNKTKEGDILTYTISGVGKFKDKCPAACFHGELHYQTSSLVFSHLNDATCTYESVTDERGDSRMKLWGLKGPIAIPHPQTPHPALPA